MFKTIEWRNGRVFILDQRRLPLEVSYIECTDYGMVAACIRDMNIRGAPAIGIAAAMGIALGAGGIKAGSFDEFMRGLRPVFDALLKTRPTAVNIKWAVERIERFLNERRGEPVDSLPGLLADEAQKILNEDIEVNRAIGKWGARFIKDGMNILTHCNAGALATGGIGTATAPMLAAKEEGKRIHVFSDETRPFLQGARLTSWELMQEGIPVTLITDSSAGALMQRGEIDLVIVGTDRTVRNGDVANKIGTYSVAVLAKENGIPFYVAAPLSSIDFTIPDGGMIPIEERTAEEVTTITGGLSTPGCNDKVWGSICVAPEGVGVRNIAFDVTPAKYVTAIITELGAFRPRDLKRLMDKDVNLDELRL
ncbi:MAG: S-methyl-5-thioribose-1-phosphate isomerase [Thermodesulfovibrionales bacterium]|nr:S-methyl-5-thioribose-1-phosphate isomerase [Thermodesulfovibrionales bacterium]